MARDLGCRVTDLLREARLRQRIDPAKYVTDQVGLPTLQDILAELAKPGRDPRAQFDTVRFTAGVETTEETKLGITLPGVVTNLTAMGVFVAFGVHHAG